MSEISGGITNLLWKLTPKLETGLAPVVVRIFGEQTDLLIDREREKEVLLQLNRAGFGAPVRILPGIISCPVFDPGTVNSEIASP